MSSYKVICDVDLIPETKVSRRISLRIDSYGMYLLFWEGETLLAGDVFQYPWNKSPHLTKGYSWFVWERGEYD